MTQNASKYWEIYTRARSLMTAHRQRELEKLLEQSVGVWESLSPSEQEEVWEEDRRQSLKEELWHLWGHGTVLSSS